MDKSTNSEALSLDLGLFEFFLTTNSLMGLTHVWAKMAYWVSGSYKLLDGPYGNYPFAKVL